YGFNGKERDKSFGNSLVYDYGFRIYNPQIGKFLSVDPLTKEYPWYTPYQFAGNTPIQAVDLDGLEELHYVLYKKLDGSTELFKLREERIVEEVITGAINVFGYTVPVNTQQYVNRYSYVVMHFAYERNTLIPCRGGDGPCGGFFPVAWDTDRNERYRDLNTALKDPAINDKLDSKILSAKRSGMAQAVSFYGSLAAFGAIPRGSSKGPETYYRTMSKADYDQFVKTGKVPATGETFISPTAAFSEGYEGVLVEFTLRPGTTEALKQIGVRDKSNLTRTVVGEMQEVSELKQGWTKNNAYFKGEGQQINIGLGKGKALDTFNDNIKGFKVLRE
ncbi:MAG: hypothetical protein JXR03_20845, partial [Cyclobacteriaceae bacterium]